MLKGKVNLSPMVLEKILNLKIPELKDLCLYELVSVGETSSKQF